jgi:hypothetical protein
MTKPTCIKYTNTFVDNFTLLITLMEIKELQHILQEAYTIKNLTIVKHPLYVGAALLVLPWVGILFDNWLGMLIGLIDLSG